MIYELIDYTEITNDEGKVTFSSTLHETRIVKDENAEDLMNKLRRWGYEKESILGGVKFTLFHDTGFVMQIFTKEKDNG